MANDAPSEETRIQRAEDSHPRPPKAPVPSKWDADPYRDVDFTPPRFSYPFRSGLFMVCNTFLTSMSCVVWTGCLMMPFAVALAARDGWGIGVAVFIGICAFLAIMVAGVWGLAIGVAGGMKSERWKRDGIPSLSETHLGATIRGAVAFFVGGVMCMVIVSTENGWRGPISTSQAVAALIVGLVFIVIGFIVGAWSILTERALRYAFTAMIIGAIPSLICGVIVLAMGRMDEQELLGLSLCLTGGLSSGAMLGLQVEMTK